MESNELMHYGILGMKWGVRRTPAQLARARGQTKSEKEEKKATPAKKATSIRKSASEMTDDELDKVVRRLQLEKRYNELNPKTVSAGEKFAKTVMNQIIAPAAIEVGKQVTKDYMTKLAKSLQKSK